VLAAALGPAGRERELAAARPQRPSQAVELARGHDPIELVLARALGAEWLDQHLEKWSSVTLEIDGADLIAAGIPQGPALGRGLAAALRAKLDGEIEGRERELATALAAARAE
jgi:tRNA nucleotidyltransferase (CCA-adding enzyme)